MQVDRMYYPVTTLGYGKRIGIWTIGCNHHCYNCSNPELWGNNPTKEVPVAKIIEYIKRVPEIDGITITGGDPFEQPEELLALVKELKAMEVEDILVYSGYTIEDLRDKNSETKEILSLIGVLIDGKYIDELNDNKSIRGSSNQRIHILNNNLYERYHDCDNWKRQTQILIKNRDIQAIGLPIRDI